MITNQELQTICSNIVLARKIKKLRAREVHDRLSQHYNLSFSAYRSLEARSKPHNLDNDNYKVQLNKILLRVLSTILDTPLNDLVERPVYDRLPDGPRVAAHAFTTDIPTDVYVPASDKVAARLSAYVRQYRYTPRSFQQAVAYRADYKISESHMRGILNGRQAHLITHDLLTAAAEVFTTHRTREGHDPFDREWLIKCHGTCPHCEEWRIYD